MTDTSQEHHGNGHDHHPPRLVPDDDVLKLFVEVMFKNARKDGFVSFRVFEDNGKSERAILYPAYRLDDYQFNELMLIPAERAATWPRPAVFAPPVCTFKNNYNARTDNIHEGPVLSVECDATPILARHKLEALLGVATIVVESGGEWINPETGEIEAKVHLHWRLVKPASGIDELAQLYEARALAAQLVGADPTAKSIVHPMRWPGSWHRKKTPKLARIETLEEDAEIDLGEALGRLREAAEAAGLAPVNGAGGIPSDKREASHPSMIGHALSAIPNGTDPKAHDWEYWNKTGMTIWASDNGEAGRLAFHEWSAKSPKNDKAETEKRWQHYFRSPPNRLGFGSLVYRAREADPNWRYGDGLGLGIDTAFIGQLLREYVEAADGPEVELAELPAMALVEEEAEVVAPDNADAVDASDNADASPDATTEPSSEPGPEPESKPELKPELKSKPKPIPAWFYVMLVVTNDAYREFTSASVPGMKFGPYPGPKDFMSDFLTRSVREGIADEIIIQNLISEEAIETVKKRHPLGWGGALHNHCLKHKLSRDDLEKLIASAKEDVALENSGGDASAPLPPPLDTLVAKTTQDPGAPFEKDNLNALLELRRKNRPSFEALRAQLKTAKCRVGELDRALGPSPKPKLVLVAQPGQPSWRETAEDGSPLPSFENAKRAIIAHGVECAYDEFHNKLLVGYQIDPTRHIIEQSEMVTDHGVMGLRTKLSDAYNFDLTERHVRDAVVSIALDNRFDPVLDMLTDAEKNWDGVARLDRVAADYFNCEDTPLNAACFRKHLIAGVARVRNPGCKHDEIVVLESKEGWNKSTALRVLAMDDQNFSDEKIIGKESREVQEQLAGIWIHENSELAGMRKAEIEAVKAYARRQSDKARPAYGHFLEDQPRRGIDFGTTNNDQYMLSQTGNRCFWGMKMVTRIDLEKLKRDRLQIWGEAAHYQSKGEVLTIGESLWPDATAEQEARRVRHPWEDVLAGLALVPTKGSASARYLTLRESGVHILHLGICNGANCEMVATSSIFEHALKIPVGQLNNSHGMTLSGVMKVLGWERPNGGNLTLGGKRVKGYYRVK